MTTPVWSRTDSRRTPYNDAYGSCERTRAELRVYTGDISPDQVTETLQLVPTEVLRRGEYIPSRIPGRGHTQKHNGWFLSSEEYVHSLDLRRHLDWLLEKLQPVQAGLYELQMTPGMKMNIDCLWWSASGHGGPTLWPEQMLAMAQFGLECSFDVYFFGEEDPFAALESNFSSSTSTAPPITQDEPPE